MLTAGEFWRPIINDFNPIGHLDPKDVRRFFVDRNENDPTRSLLKRLRQSFLNSARQLSPYKTLLTGHMGSGKSTELIRLGEELSEEFFVVRFDAEFTLAPESANHFDILLGMGLAIFAAAKEAGLGPDKKLAEDLLKSLSKFVRKYENRKGFSLRLDQLLKQVAAMLFVAGAATLVGPVGAGGLRQA